MKYRVDFEPGETVFYSAQNRQCRVRIIAINEKLSLDEMFTVKVLGKGHPVYHKGQVFTTSGNWLSKTPSKVIKPR